MAVPAAQVDREQGTRDRIEAGAEHDRVERELLLADPEAALADLVDRLVADRDEPDVVAVVRLEVARVDAHPLGADGMVVRTEELGDLGIVHAPADLLAQELAQELVRGGILEDVPVGRVEAESADRVALLELALALLGSRLPDALRARVPGVPGGGRSSQAAEGAIALLPAADGVRCERAVPGRDAEVRGPLEHRQVRGLLRDDRDGLDGGGAGADHADALAGDVHALVRPQARVVQLAGEPLEAGEIGDPRHREAPRRHDQEGCREALAVRR